MLYLEDYLEMIEHLPQELRDRFTEMRELDLTVQNNMDSLEKKTRSFFLQCKRGELQDAAAEAEYQNLRKEYYKVLEDADEKVAIATQIHELVERYLRRLDSELFKFKCELEADNNGITEILEARSLAKKDGNPTVGTSLMNVIGLNQKENRYYGAISPGSVVNNHTGMIIASGGLAGHAIASPSVGQIKDNRYRTPKPEKRRNSTSAMTTLPEKRPNLSNTLPPAPLANSIVRPLTPGVGTHTHGSLSATTSTVATPTNAATVAYNLQHMGTSASNAIAVAASQAIVATQQMQHGRRTASLKASYEAIHGSTGGPTEFWISRDITNAASTVPQTTIQSVGSEKKQKKKLNTCLSHTGSVLQGAVLTPSLTLTPSTPTVNAADAIDMLPPPSNTTAIAFGSLGLNSIGNAGAVISSNSSRSNVATVSASATTNAVSTAASNFTENGLVLEQTTEGEWSYDPNEPRYCTCNQVSYGDMVACDNDACPYEWFHYPCVGITQPPKGKWYCPKCTASMRRRGNRKNL